VSSRAGAIGEQVTAHGRVSLGERSGFTFRSVFLDAGADFARGRWREKKKADGSGSKKALDPKALGTPRRVFRDYAAGLFLLVRVVGSSALGPSLWFLRIGVL